MGVADNYLYGEWQSHSWHMTFAERAALLLVLQKTNPNVSLEIGTFLGGSLQPISKFSKRVLTFDIDANQHRMWPLFPNVSFVTGDSSETLPTELQILMEKEEEINFILIDGSHEMQGVRSDIDNCLKYVPTKGPLFILMHDSANPDVRKGILAAQWQDNTNVHELYLDFVPGALYDRPDIKNQIWGGLALAVLLPELREGDLVIDSHFEYSRSAFMDHIKRCDETR